MAKRSIVVIVLLSLALMSLCMSIPQCSGALSALTVEVHNKANGAPIVGAIVTISGPESHTATTGASGKVTFSNIASGNYTIVAAAPEFPHESSNYVYADIFVSGQTTIVSLVGYTQAYFVFSPAVPYTNDVVTFNASESSSSGTILDYSWDFGDGAKGTGVTPTHVYTTPGTYNVWLTVTSNVGSAPYSQVVRVIVPYENNFPWVILLVPLIIPIVLYLRRKPYYVVIQARVPTRPVHPHCPGDGTECDECKLTPC